MNRHNASMNTFALRQLALDPADRVLEIGFGGGVMLRGLMDKAAFVAGIDRSQEMVRRAQQVFADAVALGQAEFRQGYVEAIPFPAAWFGKVCTVNTVYFWASLDAGLKEIHRVLFPGGRLVLGFLPREHMERMKLPEDIFTTRAADEIVAVLKRCGFHGVSVKRPDETTAWNVIVALRDAHAEQHEPSPIQKFTPVLKFRRPAPAIPGTLSLV